MGNWHGMPCRTDCECMTRDRSAMLMLEQRLTTLELEVTRLRHQSRAKHVLVRSTCPDCGRDFEPPRDLRSLGYWSPATAAGMLRLLKKACSNSAGGTYPRGSSSRLLLNQSTHSRVANSTASMFLHGPRRRMTSVLKS